MPKTAYFVYLNNREQICSKVVIFWFIIPWKYCPISKRGKKVICGFGRHLFLFLFQSIHCKHMIDLHGLKYIINGFLFVKTYYFLYILSDLLKKDKDTWKLYGILEKICKRTFGLTEFIQLAPCRSLFHSPCST